MKYLSFAVLAIIFLMAFAGPESAASFPKRAESGSYTVPGLGARKEEITAAGAANVDMAVAMLET